MLKKSFAFILAIFVTTAGAYAGIYKCVSENGVVTYSDHPCGKGEEVIPNIDLSVDEAIGNASPYAEPVSFSYSIRYDVLRHAKKVGKSLFPNAYLIEENIGAEYQPKSPVWTVFLSYGYRQYKYDYLKTELEYVGEKMGDKLFVRLKYIRINSSDLEIPMPALENSKKMEKDGHRGWHVLTTP